MTNRTFRLAAPSVAVLALVSSIVGIVNQFTYDDRYIVEMNPLMRAGHWARVLVSSYWPRDWGGDGYRPLTMLAFKVEFALGHGSPIAFHAASIALYACTSVLVYWLARQLLPNWAAWLTAALFAVHPVHVEAVANVVGQSEILVALAILGATILYLRDRLRGALEPATVAWLCLLYAIGCFAKEHGVVLPAILAAAEFSVIRDDAPLGDRVRRLRPTYLAFVLIAVLFVGVRAWVLSDHSLGGFRPFTPFSTLNISAGDRVLTAFGVVPEWLRLLYWPAHLSSEYGPPAIQIAQGWRIGQAPGILLLVGAFALALVLRRRQPVITFGVALAAITLLPSSNFILPAGIVLAERTLFLPSVGAMLVLGALCVLGAEWARARFGARRDLVTLARGVIALPLVAGAAWSAERTTVWRNNDRLFHQAVIDSPDAYRAHYMLGAWSFENKRKREGEAEYRKALNLFPYDPFLSYNMAEQYRLAGLCGPAVPLYRWTHGLDPHFPLGHGAFAWCLLNEGFYAEARSRALDAIRIGSDIKAMRRVIFLADSVTGAGRSHGARAGAHQTAVAGKLPESVPKTRPATNPGG
ncbi:MAG: hypothetical protein ACREPM_16860 [Gemmatimonadaceae bacterium]